MIKFYPGSCCINPCTNGLKAKIKQSKHCLKTDILLLYFTAVEHPKMQCLILH